MKKSLLFTSISTKSTTNFKILLWILVVLPVFSFAIEFSNPITQNPSQLSENSAVIYMTSGAIMVGADEIHAAKIIYKSNSAENSNLKPTTSKEKALSIKSKKVETQKTTKPVAKKVEKQSSFLFINFPSSGNTFSQSSGFYAHGVIPTNFLVQKFSAIEEEVLENFKIQVFQRKENSYTYLLFSASQHCRISSLRAPPVA